MKIGASYEKSLLAAGGPKPDKKTAASAAEARTTGGTDVKLSGTAATLAQVEKQLAATEAFDTKKVEAVKQAISEGRFKVDTERVADKLIMSVRELLGKSN